MRRSRLAVGTLLLAGCSTATLPSGGLDSLSRIGAAALPIGPEKEREIGFGIAAIVAGRYPVLDAPELTHYVALVGQTVAGQSVRQGEVDFVFGVLDSDEVNAFASPGGFVLITRGALAAMESEAELAGVLAHEIAHIDEKQVLNEIRRSDVLRTARDEASLQGALLDQIAGVGASTLLSGLSRGDEMVADSLALLYVAATGYRVDALSRFLRRLQEREGDGAGRLDEIRATHPPLEERATALERQIRIAGYSSDQGVEARERFLERVPRPLGSSGNAPAPPPLR